MIPRNRGLSPSPSLLNEAPTSGSNDCSVTRALFESYMPMAQLPSRSALKVLALGDKGLKTGCNKIL